MSGCEAYIVTTLIVTTTYIVHGREWSPRYLALAMFFPGIFAPWFAQDDKFLAKVLGVQQNVQQTITFSVLGGLLVILTLSICVIINVVLGWGQVDEHAKVDMSENHIFRGFLKAAGEEIGWRCYLLPCLLQKYSTIQALFIGGVVWGLYHIPIMVLLSHRCKVENPYRTVAVQFTSCVLSSIPHGWLAMRSGFSLWAPTFMHFAWNRLNPVILGNIYLQQEGKVKGKLWLINGEGVAGCLALAAVAFLICYNL